VWPSTGPLPEGSRRVPIAIAVVLLLVVGGAAIRLRRT
jgi:hypothetical protein